MHRSRYVRAREFFTALRWTCGDAQSTYGVFTDDELENSPLKWLKYVLLERVGLTTIEELKSSIRRFQVDAISSAERACHEMFGAAEVPVRESMIVIKVVFSERPDNCRTTESLLIMRSHPHSVSFVAAMLQMPKRSGSVSLMYQPLKRISGVG